MLAYSAPSNFGIQPAPLLQICCASGAVGILINLESLIIRYFILFSFSHLFVFTARTMKQLTSLVTGCSSGFGEAFVHEIVQEVTQRKNGIQPGDTQKAAQRTADVIR
jgi:hypothetical protein